MSKENENLNEAENSALNIADVRRSKLDFLNRRLGFIIQSLCNEIGCKDCPAKWDESCQAIDLQNQIFQLEYN